MVQVEDQEALAAASVDLVGPQAEASVEASAVPEDHQAAALAVPVVQDLVEGLVEDIIITAEALVGC